MVDMRASLIRYWLQRCKENHRMACPKTMRNVPCIELTLITRTCVMVSVLRRVGEMVARHFQPRVLDRLLS